MAFLNFFKKKEKTETNINAQNIDINKQLTEICGRLRKIENQQKEASLQLEEIDDFLHSNNDERVLVDALTELVDMIENFYRYAADNTDSAFFEQAGMMWGAAKNTADTVGLEILEFRGEPFDFRLCSAESTGSDDGIPNGYVIKTLKCGYIYKNEMMRRAAVIVNKIDTSNEREVL